MTKRFEKGYYLIEQWCHLVPGSRFKSGPLQIEDLVEQTEEYEIYDATAVGMPCKIKVYLDPKVKPERNKLLGLYCYAESPAYDLYNKNLYVFEVIEGWEVYDGWCRSWYDTFDCSEGANLAQGLAYEMGPKLTDRIDEETGIVYQVDDKGYVWQDGQKTDMWFTEDGKLIKPRTDFEGTIEESDALPEEPMPEPPKGFDCVVGMEELKQQLRDEVLWPMQHKELMEQYRLHPLNGMLLYGPPGCGKTYIAQKFAEETGMNFELVTAGSVTGYYLHQTGEKLKEMFDNARQKAPCILCIDEIDSLVPDRTRVGLESGAVDINESVNEFLSQMNNCSKDGVFVIGSTNNPYALDGALLRTGRMDKIIYVGLPDGESRKALIEYYLKNRPQDEGIDTVELARLADGMNASDIEFMINSVAMKAAMTQALITFDNLAEQAKTQRRSVYMPKDGEQAEAVKPIPANTRVMGFAMPRTDCNKEKKNIACA